MTGFRVALGGALELYASMPTWYPPQDRGGGLPVAFSRQTRSHGFARPARPRLSGRYLSGNPLAMAAGIATVSYLRHNAAQVYPRLEATARAVAEGVAAEAARAGVSSPSTA